MVSCYRGRECWLGTKCTFKHSPEDIAAFELKNQAHNAMFSNRMQAEVVPPEVVGTASASAPASAPASAAAVTASTTAPSPVAAPVVSTLMTTRRSSLPVRASRPYRKRCYYKQLCTYGPNCTYPHSDEEKLAFENLLRQGRVFLGRSGQAAAVASTAPAVSTSISSPASAVSSSMPAAVHPVPAVAVADAQPQAGLEHKAMPLVERRVGGASAPIASSRLFSKPCVHKQRCAHGPNCTFLHSETERLEFHRRAGLGYVFRRGSNQASASFASAATARPVVIDEAAVSAAPAGTAAAAAAAAASALHHMQSAGAREPGSHAVHAAATRSTSSAGHAPPRLPNLAAPCPGVATYDVQRGTQVYTVPVIYPQCKYRANCSAGPLCPFLHTRQEINQFERLRSAVSWQEPQVDRSDVFDPVTQIITAVRAIQR